MAKEKRHSLRLQQLFYIVILVLVNRTHGANSRDMNPSSYCTFPSHWSGSWFQSGIQTSIEINTTHILQKGSCVESDSRGKFLLHDREESCYRCLVLYEMHPTVLQYKESYCVSRASLDDICGDMVGDAPLYSMFRTHPPPVPVPCPFRGAPFAFSYNKGSGECAQPISRAESCTQESRLLLKYQACPDVHNTESHVEELVCLASFKEGSIKYLVGKITQVNRRIDTSTHEETYRCFVYKKSHSMGRVSYEIAQSADATCNGLTSMQNIIEGSKTMRLTSVDNQHNRCRFPSWITDHHKWYSLDHSRVYHFSHKNATLRISDSNNDQLQQSGAIMSDSLSSANTGVREMRLVCHAILQAVDNNRVQIIAHVTEGCNSGHICMAFARRDTGVIELQQSETVRDHSDDACHDFHTSRIRHQTLITSTLQPRPCPHAGKYYVRNEVVSSRKKRQKPSGEDGTISNPSQTASGATGGATVTGSGTASVAEECSETSRMVHSLEMGCSATSNEMLVFRSQCSDTAYTCHGSWHEAGVNYLIAAPISRKSNDVRRYCFAYTHTHANGSATAPTSAFQQQQITFSGNYQQSQSLSRPQSQSGQSGPRGGVAMRLSLLAETCHRDVELGSQGERAYNLTGKGTCADHSSATRCFSHLISILCLIWICVISILTR
uniref:Putative conserved secreted protein n=1 Tax=Xenopsylla cheopis TaxID=163159 RepID=A0A6M2DED8_XENCH